MSCFACSKSYGFFTKEVGCPNCGFSFCTKCLKKTIEVPKCNNAVKKVCLKCYETLLAKNLETKAKEMSKVLGVSTDEATSHTSVIDAPIPESEQLPDVDESIKRRLNAIKEINNLDGDESKENNTPKDIGQRLASLKGTEYKEYDHKDIIHAKDNRSEQERINDLMKRYAEENEIDESGRGSGTSGDNDDEDPIKSIEKRLAALKGESNTSNKPTNTENQEPVDEAAVVKHIVKKYLDEAKLPDSDLTPEEKEFVNSQKPTAETEELPWCTICNDDAVVRCIGCDGDLFCRSCFKEIHDNDEEYREHPTKRYVKDETKNQNN